MPRHETCFIIAGGRGFMTTPVLSISLSRQRGRNLGGP